MDTSEMRRGVVNAGPATTVAGLIRAGRMAPAPVRPSVYALGGSLRGYVTARLPGCLWRDRHRRRPWRHGECAVGERP